SNGNNYKAIKGMLFLQIMKQGTIKVFITKLKAEVEGDKGLADMGLILVRVGKGEGDKIKSIKDIIPSDAAGYRVSIVFDRHKKSFKAVSATYERAGASALM
ncbi:MAG: hypothetical protein V3T30_02960, partial [Thermodesulfobacteriota bacterium]